mgnify:CR=1 FL=1
MATEVRARGALFAAVTAGGAGDADVVVTRDALTDVFDVLQRARSTRTAGAFSPAAVAAAAARDAAERKKSAADAMEDYDDDDDDDDARETATQHAARAIASLAPLFSKQIEAQYASRAIAPGETPTRRKNKVEQAKEDAAATIMELSAEALSVIQQLTSPPDDVVFTGDDGAPEEDFPDDNVTVADAPLGDADAPSPLSVLELHERLHAALADCRCCCGAAARGGGSFLRDAIPTLTTARAPFARESRRLKELARKAEESAAARAKEERELAKKAAAERRAALRAERAAKGENAAEEEDEEEEEEEEEDDADARDKAAAKKTKAAGRGRPRGRAGAGGDDKEKNKAKAAFVRQNQKNDVRGGGGDGTVMGDGFVHYAGDVYVQSTQRPGGTHHDLAFALFRKDKTSYAFKDCDATGKYSKGKDQAILRSKIAVGRYLEREGLSEEEVEKRENALKEAKAKAEAEAKENALKHPHVARECVDFLGSPPPKPSTSSLPPLPPLAAPKPKPSTRREKIDAALKRFDDMIAQCTYCLYGAELGDVPRRCRDEGGASGKELVLTSRRACAELWRHVLPYAENLRSLGNGHGFKTVLDAVRRVFPPESALPRDSPDVVDEYLKALPAFADAEVLNPWDVASEASRGAWGRDEEFKLAREAVSRAPPKRQREAKARASRKLAAVAEDEEGGGGGDGGGGDGDGDVAMIDLADGPTPAPTPGPSPAPTPASAPAPSPGGNMWRGLADMLGGPGIETRGVDRGASSPNADAAGGGGGATGDAEEEKEPLIDPAVEFASAHETLHRFCARVADVEENDAAFERVSETLPVILDLMYHCVPVTREEAASRAARWATQAAERAKTAKKGAKSRDAPVAAATAAARHAALLKADLTHNPSSFDAWLALADHLDSCKDLALNDAAKLVTTYQWRRSPEAEARARRCQLALRRACCAAIVAATCDEERSAAYERAGLAAYEHVSRAPPFHDGRRFVMSRDAGWRRSLGLCRDAFDGAASAAPEEWTHRLMGVKIGRKLGEPLDVLFRRVDETLKLAPGNLEVFYQTHTTRVKALLKIAASSAAGWTMPAGAAGGRGKAAAKAALAKDLRLVASHAFDPEAVKSKDAGWDALWDDAVAGVRACAKMLPTYHKAHYRIAWARLRKPGDAADAVARVAEAKDALLPLFKTAENASGFAKADVAQYRPHGGGPPRFAVNMWEIEDGNSGVTRGACRRGVVAGAFKLETVGLNESARKYVSAVRRATRVYVCMCFALGDLSPLVAAPGFIGDEKNKFAKSMRDIKSLAFGLAVRAVAAACAAVVPDPRSLELAYYAWAEHGCKAAATAWDEAVAASVHEIKIERDAAAAARGDDDDDDDDAPAKLLGEPFSAALKNCAGPELDARVDASAFETLARAHVASLKDERDVATLRALLTDAAKKLADASKRAARATKGAEAAAAAAATAAATAPATRLRAFVRDALVLTIERAIAAGDVRVVAVAENDGDAENAEDAAAIAVVEAAATRRRVNANVVAGALGLHKEAELAASPAATEAHEASRYAVHADALAEAASASAKAAADGLRHVEAAAAAAARDAGVVAMDVVNESAQVFAATVQSPTKQLERAVRARDELAVAHAARLEAETAATARAAAARGRADALLAAAEAARLATASATALLRRALVAALGADKTNVDDAALASIAEEYVKEAGLWDPIAEARKTGGGRWGGGGGAGKTATATVAATEGSGGGGGGSAKKRVSVGDVGQGSGERATRLSTGGE